MTRTRKHRAGRELGAREPKPKPPDGIRSAGDTRRRAVDAAWLVGIFLLAFLLRLAILHRLLELPLHRTPQLDSLEFLVRAGRFARGDFVPPALPQHGPGYPAFIALVFLLFPGSLPALGIVQCVIGSALCVLVAVLGRRWFDRRTAVAAGILLAVNGPLMLLTSLILAEGLLLFLLALALVLFGPAPARWPRMIPTGLVLGLACAVRPTAVLLLGLLAVAAAIRNDRKSRAAAGILVASFFLALSPVLIANARAGRSLFVIQGNAGLSFYLGNSPKGTGSASARLGGSWDSIAGEAWRQNIESASAQDRYYRDKTLAEIRADPAGYLRLFGRKVAATIQSAEIRDSHAFDFFAARIPLLRFSPGFGALIALAACGIASAFRRGKPPWLALLYLLLFGASCVGLVLGYRYRSPIVPVLAIFSGLGAVALFDSVRTRRLRTAAGLSALAATVWILSRAIPRPDDPRLAEEWWFTGGSLMKEGDLSAAEAAYRTALSENEHFAPAWAGLGMIALSRSETESALRDLRRAIAEEPGYARAHFLLGSAYEQQDELPEAVQELEAARKILPNGPDTLGELARVYGRMARWTEAEEAARSFVRLYPDDAGGHRELARIEAALHRAPEALAEIQRSLAIDPTNADAWLLRAMLAIDARNPADAEQALRQAETLAGSGRPPIEFAYALLEHQRGQNDAAEKRLVALLSRQPRFREAAALLLQVAMESGHRQAAEAFLARLAATRPAPR